MSDRIGFRRGSLVLALTGALALPACETVQTTQAGAVGVERKQAMLVSSDQINSAAVSAYKQTLGAASQKGALNRNPAEVQRVRNIAQRLIPATGAFRSDAPGWKWEVNVISSPEVNAWCMPGGKIAVYTGLIDKLKPTDDELAAIIGHEIAHALREHGRERASQQMAQSLAVGVIGAAVGLGGVGQDLAGMVADVTFGLPYSRQFEREADRIGVELAARAGYDPRAAIALWQKMAKVGGGGPPELLSTHPSDESRIRDLQEYSQRVMPLYQQARR
ncbi:MAG TPA: M48 family metallopeptidase [Burkholderiales bacterium]|jgi:predicted Zn-dependent protease|nr:M48 family metallopeptidase [Burkholderiales bacterium]